MNLFFGTDELSEKLFLDSIVSEVKLFYHWQSRLMLRPSKTEGRAPSRSSSSKAVVGREPTIGKFQDIY